MSTPAEASDLPVMGIRVAADVIIAVPNSIAQAGTGGASEEVPVDTLDALAAEHGWTGIDFLKLDAEGEEERILEGAATFLRDANPLVMLEIKHGDRLHLQLVEKFKASGFEPYLLVPGLGLKGGPGCMPARRKAPGEESRRGDSVQGVRETRPAPERPGTSRR